MDFHRQASNRILIYIKDLFLEESLLAIQHKWQGTADYELQMTGHLEGKWLDWFSDISIETNSGLTIIRIKMVDQTTLQGLITRIFTLGLPLISVRCFGNLK